MPTVLTTATDRERLAATGRYYECPAPYRPVTPQSLPAVFLAGGIVGCPDWQPRAAAELIKDAVVLNPRRENFPIDDPAATPTQIRWEHEHLHTADLTLFWFPASDASVTTQPIAMFELGAALGEGRRLVVGADPDYPRIEDIRWQTELARPGTIVHTTLEATLDAARAELGGSGQAVSLRDLAAEIYDGVPVIMDEDGEWLLTHDEERAYAALDRFHRERCGQSTRDYWNGHIPAPRRAWLRPSNAPEISWAICAADAPHATPALYIGG